MRRKCGFFFGGWGEMEKGVDFVLSKWLTWWAKALKKIRFLRFGCWRIEKENGGGIGLHLIVAFCCFGNVKGEKREKKTPHFDEVFIKLIEEKSFFLFFFADNFFGREMNGGLKKKQTVWCKMVTLIWWFKTWIRIC